MRVGIESFTYHRRFGLVMKGEPPAQRCWSVSDCLHQVASLGVRELALQTCFFDKENLREVGRLAASLNLNLSLCWGHPEGLATGSAARADELREWLVVAGKEQIALVRIVCDHPEYSYSSEEKARLQGLVPLLRDLARFAAERGITLALENHGDLHTWQIQSLIETVGHPALGVLIDLGNLVRVGEEPLSAVQTLAPTAHMVHLKDMLLAGSEGRCAADVWPTVPIGSGDLPVRECITYLCGARPDCLFLIEMAQMHPKWPDVDKAVEQSLNYLQSFASCPSSPSSEFHP